ncbi:helix-turn-helix domain-containing protein [Desulforamulus hydrothermalis]|uniref:DEAD/DEAH box helicase domain protein n=1 Tax=Desulforamulus hydrothermalis Lam5 = DSM 18033 TaxID=1121428 RepID=K8E8X6_9FIRM|nr:helix-turn-helix domain-containing protein [Desulforamulus hydrothermalis]CCO07968.1 DEAD/DEAH box helicase domain protein [Desulforamulus hydrothermalis Lam5 = DSM 18033]SHG85156.1 ATP-dependent RNA helicase HelY [Desulforamulus hydrothermalis Lam5 = DSM 18033]
MVVNDKEQLKSFILTRLPEDQPIKLVDLALKLRIKPQLLLPALQSLVAQRSLKAARPQGSEGGAAGLWLARNEVPAAELARLGEGVWSYSPQLLAVRQRQLAALLEDDARGRVLRLLADGLPRTAEQIQAELGDREMPPLQQINRLIQLPDGRFTLTDTAEGQAALEQRRREEQQRQAEIAKQEQKLREVFADGQALSKQELEQLLGGPLLPQVKFPVVRLVSGRYAAADSPAAWEDAARYLAGHGPLTLTDFTRKFKMHSRLVASLRTGKEVPPFIILPDGSITTTATPAGQQETERRQAGQGLQQKLADIYRRQPFFNLGTLLEQPEQREPAVTMMQAEGACRVNVNGVGLWAAPYPHDPQVIAQELKRLTGMHLAARPGPPVLPAAWLAGHSMTVQEAADKLKLSQADILNLCELEELTSFRLAGQVRVWREEVKAIKYNPLLHKIVKGASKITTLEAADLLDTTPDRIRRLVREGYINPAGEVEKEDGRTTILVRRGDIQAIKERFPGIEHEWSLAARQQRRDAARESAKREKQPAGKKRPRRAVTPPPPPVGPLALDDFQQQAVQAALEGRHVLVAAPTGTGKTVIAERLIEAVIQKGKAAVYTSPLKALSNQKFVDFRQVFGHETVGLVTGDISINPYAPLLIMTTEIFRNRCFAEPEGLADVACVVFDEIHYLDDPERGTAWEESIIFAPPHVKFLGLSATVPNIREIADWMSEVRGEPVEVVVETNRAVPLAINWLSSDGNIMDEEEAREYIELAAQKRSQERQAERRAAREEEFAMRSRRWSKGGARRSRKPLDRH